MNVSRFIADYLEKKKIKNIFLVTGGGMMFLTDALSKSKINLIFNHHEQASFFSVDGYARLSEKIGVCFATSGPGITNLTTGILSAWQDSIPIVIVGGQCKLRETIQYSKIKNLRQYGTFEANSLDLLKPITKFSKRISDPNSIKYYLDKAFYIANDQKTFDGKNYFFYSNPELKIPTWYGIEIKGGLENNYGDKLSGENTFGKSSYVGISIPLLKDLIIDKRRSDLAQSKILVNLNQEERQLVVNDLFLDG
jgi:hypothetical protein